MHPEHDPQKWIPVFGKDHAPINNLKRDDDSKKVITLQRSAEAVGAQLVQL
jgi:hypothetical protein